MEEKAYLLPDEKPESRIREESSQDGAINGPQEEKERMLPALPFLPKCPLLTMCPALKTIPLPNRFVFSDNKLAKEILEMELNKTKTLENVMKGIDSSAIMKVRGERPRLHRGSPITGYDLVVLFAIDSLFNEEAYYQHEEGAVFMTFAPKEVTAKQIWRIVTHATGSRTPSPEQCELIRLSIEKLSGILIAINCKDELETALKKKDASLADGPLKKGVIQGPLLSMEKFKGYSGGSFVTAYRIMKPSPLYTYNNLIGQERSVDAKLLAIEDEKGRRIPDTELRIIAKHYLLARVETMAGKKKNKKKWNEDGAKIIKNWNRILYETFYDEVAKRRKYFFTEKDKEGNTVIIWAQSPDVLKGKFGGKLKADLRKYMFQVFGYWERIGYIKGTKPDPQKKYVDIRP